MYDRLSVPHVVWEESFTVHAIFIDSVMLATITGSCVRLVWKLQKRSVMVRVHVHVQTSIKPRGNSLLP